MHDSKIIKVLSAFTKEEFKEFGYFVNSPYFNRVTNVSLLLESLKKYYPDFISRNIKKEELFKKIVPGGKYNDAVMRNLSSDLFKLAEEFIGIRKFRSDENYRKLLELTGMKHKLTDKVLQGEMEKLGKLIETKINRDEEYYFDMFTFLNLRNNTFEAKTVDEFHDSLEMEIEHLSQYFVLHLFDRFFQANRLRTSYKTKAKHSFLEDVSEVLSKHGYMDSPVVKIYYNIYMITMTMDEKYYQELRKLYRENVDKLNGYTRHIIFQSLSVFFMNMQRQGKKEYNYDRFRMYRTYSESGEMIYNNDLSDAAFTSAVVAALNVGEFDWAEKFNEEFRPRLKADIRQDAYYYNKARILHAKGKNEEALQYLARVISTHHPIKAVVKVIELQILYELNMIDTIENKLDSLRHFFSKNEEMSDTMRDSLRNFHKTYQMLLDAKSGGRKFTPAQIRKHILAGKQSYSMEWLKEKTEELEKRKK